MHETIGKLNYNNKLIISFYSICFSFSLSYVLFLELFITPSTLLFCQPSMSLGEERVFLMAYFEELSRTWLLVSVFCLGLSFNLLESQSLSLSFGFFIIWSRVWSVFSWGGLSLRHSLPWLWIFAHILYWWSIRQVWIQDWNSYTSLARPLRCRMS